MISQESNIALVLNPNVELIPVREFPLDIQERLGGSAADYIISDVTSRITSQRVTSEVAVFLQRFRESKGIVEVIFDHGAALNLDPFQLLENIYPLICEFRVSTVLIEPSAVQHIPLGPILEQGDLFEDYHIVERINALAETDVYKAKGNDGTQVALKYLRSGCSPLVKDNLRREAMVLTHAAEIQCRATPAIIRFDIERDDPFIAVEWINGQTLFEFSRERRNGIKERTQVAKQLIDAYTQLHRSGILHGDIHPGNVILAADGRVRLIDFGGAFLVNKPDARVRIGQVHYYEPEVARAVLAGQAAPIPSLKGEQYCIASMIFSVITGRSPIVLSLETQTALTQIAKESPRSFEELHLFWPALEKVLTRALSKYPEDRYESIDDFRREILAALESEIPHRPISDPVGKISFDSAASHQAIFKQQAGELKKYYGLGSDLLQKGLTRGPLASIYAGGAGVAWALLRVGCLQRDPELLAAADVWISRAIAQRSDALAYTDGSVYAATETGPLALFHSVTGIYVLTALVRHAAGDIIESRNAIRSFMQSVTHVDDSQNLASRIGEFQQDLTNGAPGLLLGVALLLPLCHAGETELAAQLKHVARKMCGLIERQLGMRSDNSFLGFAHGRTGAIYALLKWSDVSGDPLPASVPDHLRQLLSFAQSSTNEKYFPVDVTNPKALAWTGWCHGSAGHMLTLTLASSVLKRSEYLDMAISNAWHIWNSRGQSGPTLCCGSAGEALSLFECARYTEDNTWIDRGLELTLTSISNAARVGDIQGLFRGHVGIALAAAEAIEPMKSRWPVCQSML